MSRQNKLSFRNSVKFMPVVVALVVASLTVSIWKLMETREKKHIQDRIRLLTGAVHDQLEHGLIDRGLSILRMAKRWEYRGGLDKEEWQAEARLYLQHYPGYQAIERVDSQFYVRWIEPLAGNETVLNANLGFEEHRRKALEDSREHQSIVMTPPINLIQGGAGFLIAAPIYQQNKNEGFILGVFRVRDFLNVELNNVAKGLSVSIFSHGKEIYYRCNGSQQHENPWSQTAFANIFGEQLEIRVWPTDASLTQIRGRTNDAILIAGLLLAAFLGVTIWLIHRTKIQSQKLSETGRALEETDATLRERGVQLNAVLQSTADGILVVSKEGKIINANQQFAKMWRITHDLLQTNDDKALLRYIADQLVDPEAFLNKVQRLYRSDEMSVDTILFKDGRIFERFTNVVYCDEKRIGRLWSFRDVTARRKAESDLKASEARYRRLVENAKAIVYMFSTKKGGVYYSPRVQEVLGYSPEYLYANPFLWNESIHPNDRVRVDKTIRECEAGRAFDVEYRIKDARGNWRWVHDCSISRTIGDGEVLIEGLATDITDRKKRNRSWRHGQNCTAAFYRPHWTESG